MKSDLTAGRRGAIRSLAKKMPEYSVNSKSCGEFFDQLEGKL